MGIQETNNYYTFHVKKKKRIVLKKSYTAWKIAKKSSADSASINN